MKKFMLTVIVVFLTISISWADDRPITVEQLPQKAQQFLKSYYPQEGVAYATEDKKMKSTEYEVMLNNGAKIEFSTDGEWKSVARKMDAVPAEIVPQQIRDYVAKSYPDAKITKIERDCREYEVTLSNRLELTFNKEFKLIDVDD